jgi:tRNA(Ile)-lysidine synthase
LPGLDGPDPEALFAPLAGYPELGLAVSGGPDSLGLLLLAARWAAPRGIALFVYTVDHALRPEAAAEAAMVVREAEALGLAARALRWDGAKPASGVMAAARAARYRLLATAMAADGVRLLLTAHHLGDQAETVLMRLAHGSGIDGLRGMDRQSVVEGCEIYRPLLGLRPDVLRDIVRAAGLTPAADPSNLDSAYERVRWRQLLPALAAEGLTLERLGTLARRMEEASALIHAEAEAHYPRIVTPLSATEMELAAGRLATLNPAVATALLGQVLGLVKGDRGAPPLGPLEALAARLQGGAPLKGLTLHGCLVSSDGASIRVRREPPRRAARQAAAALIPD